MVKKAANIVGNILIVVVLIFALTVTALVVASSFGDNGIPSVLGYSILNVESDSMEGENGFYVGDLIVIRLLEEEEANNLNVGDVITFQRSFKGEVYLETHRIVENIYETYYTNEIVDGIRIHNGKRCYTTKGDNTPGVDMSELNEIDYSTEANIIGLWTGKAIPKLGAAIKFLQSQKGFLICIVIPLALFFFFELYRFIVTVNEKKKEKALADVAASEDDIKQKAVAEYLAQQAAAKEAAAGAEQEKAQQAVPTPAATEAAPAVTEAAPEEAPTEEKKPEMSDEEKQRIIDEYLASQQKKETKDE